jgi:hypothetical protein
MVPKNVCIALLGATLLAWGSGAVADEYRGDEVLSLDLPKAVLSPKLLGPASQFTPGPLDVTLDRGGDNPLAPVAVTVAPSAKIAPPAKIARPAEIVHPKLRVTHARTEKPRGASRTKLARRHGNPLDAQASDTRVQVWPCKSGGICNWQR